MFSNTKRGKDGEEGGVSFHNDEGVKDPSIVSIGRKISRGYTLVSSLEYS